jgi:ABC-2 type transport system ATP-binding protein
MNSAISIKNFTKYYGSFKAVDDLCLEVPEGEFFGFLGPNGAGKTTTINAVTGLGNFQQGQIEVFGHDVKSEYKKTRSFIGLSPQEINVDPYLDVEGVLFYTAGYFGLSRRDAKERAEELLKQFDLLGHRRLGYKKLSGGLKRRLLIARALVHRPRILILDEPTAGVDLELRYQLWEELKRMNEAGTTIFLTTHYIEEAERLCKRIGIIFKGKLVACEETGSLIHQKNGKSLEDVFAHMTGIRREI